MSTLLVVVQRTTNKLADSVFCVNVRIGVGYRYTDSLSGLRGICVNKLLVLLERGLIWLR